MKHFFFSLVLLVGLFSVAQPAQAARDEALQLLSGLLSVGAEAVQPSSAKPQAASGVQNVTAQFTAVFDDLKDAYKQEGREYAQELGDVVVERIVQDKKVNAALTSVRHLCYAVIAYLTAVTLLIIFFFTRIMSAIGKLRAELRHRV